MKIIEIRRSLRVALLNHFGQNAAIQVIANGINLSRSETSRVMNEKVDLSLKKIFEIEDLIDTEIINIVHHQLDSAHDNFPAANQVTAKMKFAIPWIMRLIKQYSQAFQHVEQKDLRPIFRERPAYISFNIIPINSTKGGYHLAFIKPSTDEGEIKIQFIAKNIDFKNEIKEIDILTEGRTRTKYFVNDQKPYPYGHPQIIVSDFSSLEIGIVIGLLKRVYEIQAEYKKKALML